MKRKIIKKWPTNESPCITWFYAVHTIRGKKYIELLFRTNYRYDGEDYYEAIFYDASVMEIEKFSLYQAQWRNLDYLQDESFVDEIRRCKNEIELAQEIDNFIDYYHDEGAVFYNLSYVTVSTPDGFYYD